MLLGRLGTIGRGEDVSLGHGSSGVLLGQDGGAAREFDQLLHAHGCYPFDLFGLV